MEPEPEPKRQCCENMICSRCFHHNCNAECYNCLCCIMMKPVPTPTPVEEVVQEPEADAESEVDFDNEKFLFEICGTCCQVNAMCDCL